MVCEEENTTEDACEANLSTEGFQLVWLNKFLVLRHI